MSKEPSSELVCMPPPDWAVKAAAKIWQRLVGAIPPGPLGVASMAEIITACFHEEQSTVLTGHLEATSDSSYFAGLAMQSILQMGGIDGLKDLAESTPSTVLGKIKSLTILAWGIAEAMEAQGKVQQGTKE
ncbi:MAG: hypothetical protein NT011_13625 [Kiritimatiellaeota bacterium]|nr:hypothetical protein [Kiritimatiellota bacterium]